MTDRLRNGRKEIIEYLRPYLDLPERQDMAWQKIRRWKRVKPGFALVIITMPTGKLQMDTNDFISWYEDYKREWREARKHD